MPHCSGYGTEKPGSQARFRAVKAEGGWAAVCTEYAPVSYDSDESPYISSRIWDDEDMRNLAVMAEGVHEHGALAGLQLVHTGAHAGNRQSRMPTVAPSQLASDYEPFTVPKALEKRDIARIREDWVRGAERAREAGFDIVYVYGGHSYLPLQFLSPFYNRRTDEYGGSFENRARFFLETIEAVKGAVGDDCALVVRMAVEALGPAGVELDEGLAFVRLADPLVDLWDVTIGSIADWALDSGSSRFFEEGYQLEWTGRMREATQKPVVGVARLTSADRMAEIVSSGVWDLVGAARPSISDPFLPKKIEEGRYGEIRECIGCNVCISKSEVGHHLGCTQNATAGEEYRRGWHPERFEPAANADRGVLVVGAGPAGMECAVVLGKRGFEAVHLADDAEELGGQMRWVRRLPGLGEWGRIVDWRHGQLDLLRSVEFVPRRRLDAAAVRDYGAQIVIVATGARWATDGLNAATHDPIPGADASLPHVLTPEQLMLDGKRPPGERVLVWDCEGYFAGTGVAERLALDGHSVDLATSLHVIAPYTDETLEGPQVRQRLHEVGVRQHRGVQLLEVTPGGVRATDEFGEPFELETDAVCLVTQRLSEDALYHELVADPAALEAEGIEAVYRIGDCVSPRIIAEAVFDGHRLGREIDAEHPDHPLPYVRERLVL